MLYLQHNYNCKKRSKMKEYTCYKITKKHKVKLWYLSTRLSHLKLKH